MTIAVAEAEKLLERVGAYMPRDEVKAIEQAYEYAAASHKGQSRKSGEPYIVHPLAAASLLADLRLDKDTIVAALLHDVMEDCGVTFDEIAHKFGHDAARLVDGVTKLTRLNTRFSDPADAAADPPTDDPDRLYAESLRKMLVAMAEDIRVVLIKLADRLHNMQTLDALPPNKRKRISQETLDIYAPLAHRLGIWEIKWRLEDLAFRHLNEDKYREISRYLATRRAVREEYVERVTERLREALAQANVSAEAYGRPKSIYSIYRKTLKYAAQGKELSDIYDLYAIRVLVENLDDCYKALGMVHSLWRPLPGQFDDYIANPKPNLYQALHTTVICESGNPLEVQIKTRHMHEVAEYGVAAHWSYKEGKSADGKGGNLKFEDKMTWLRQMLEWQRDVTATQEFIENVKQDIFHDQVFVYTPKGDIVELSAGSTPVDFAYKIHTELGHRCIGAKVNGRIMPLDSALENGNTVEILTTRTNRGPSLDWLNPNLGYVRSVSGRQKIRQWFRRQARGANIQRGRELLKKELRRQGLRLSDAEILALVKQDSMDDLLYNLGSGGLSETQLTMRLAQARQAEPEEPELPKLIVSPQSPSSGVTVQGVGELLVRMARCCNPIPGDAIIGFVTRTRGVTIHKQDCPSLKNEDEPERIIRVDWGLAQELYPVRVKISAYDRVGLLRDITIKVAEERVNVSNVDTDEHPDGTVHMELTMHTTGLDQLGKLFAKLEGIRGIRSVTRVRHGHQRRQEAAGVP